MSEDNKPPHEPKHTPIVRSLLAVVLIVLGFLGFKHSVPYSWVAIALGCLLLTLSVE